MTRFHLATRRSRILPVAASVAAALGASVLLASGSATADNSNRAVPAPPAVPTSADQIQNIDQVKTAIKGYYKDTPAPATDPVTLQPTTLHFPAPDGPYVHEMAGIEQTAEKYLRHPHRPGDHPVKKATKAVLFDIDDTTLNTYNYEIYSNFVFNPTTNAAFVNTAAFPAVPGMPALEAFAVSHGYTVFFLTGRPVSQRPGTETNLTNAGYTFDTSKVYLKDLTAPWLSSCATATPVCTTIQYKSLTRQHIESLGYDIVANFGDQFSDLTGGFADKTFKLPNPMYFLP
jgi:hypothetical protein